MNNKTTLIASAVATAFLMPGLASASFVLDTGIPVVTTGGSTLSTAQSLAGEFFVAAGEDITQVAAYLNAAAGGSGSTFTFDIYSATSFLGIKIGTLTPTAVASATGTFTANGWTSASMNWTPTTSGDYWLALQVASTADTKGLAAPTEASAATGTVPAIAFAYENSTGTTGKYVTAGAPSLGLEVTAASPVPLPAAVWLLGSGLLAGLGAASRRRRADSMPRI